jgi:hypothetical protein
MRFHAAMRFLVAAFAGLAALVWFFWPMFASRFQLLPGTLGDWLLINVILEHWYNVAHGWGVWTSPPMFYPHKGVLGYSDAVSLFAPLYVAGRAAGLSTFHSFTVTIATLLLIGYAGAIWLLRRVMGVPFGIAVVCGLIFAFSNTNVVHLGHPQLFASAFVPWLFGLAVLYAQALADGRWGMGPGVACAVLLASILYTSYYVGWFSTLFLVMWGSVVAVGYAVSGREGMSWNRSRLVPLIPSVLLVAAAFVLALVPFLVTYLPAYRELGPRRWDQVLASLPAPIDLINVSPSNLVWGWTEGMLIPRGREFSWEKNFGFPVVELLLFFSTVAVAFWHFCKRSPNHLAGSMDANRSRLAASLGVTVILSWLLMFRIADASLWKPVYFLIPGASAIKAVFRFQTVLAVAVVAVGAIGLSSAWKLSVRRPAVRLSLIVLLAFLPVEQWSRDLHLFDADAEAERLARIEMPPRFCKAFVVTENGGADRLGYAANLEAALVAIRTGIPTVNGYSGSVPKGWGLNNPAAPEYPVAVATWTRAAGVVNGLCALNLDSRDWRPVRAEVPPIRGLNFVRFKPESIDQALGTSLNGFHAEETGGRWTAGSASIIFAQAVHGQRIVIEGFQGNRLSDRIKILVNGRTLFDEDVRSGPFQMSFPMSEPIAEISFESTTFIPAVLKINNDPRQLGFVVSRVEIK